MSLLLERRIPSAEVGEYCEWEDRRGKYLFPLEEEGSYGPLPEYKSPGKWTEPAGYSKRERKPKVYASYAINMECAFHGPKLDRFEREPSPRKTPPRTSPPRVIAKPKRATSLPPEASSSTMNIQKSVGAPRNRVSSVPPSSPTPEYSRLDLDISEMTGKLRVSRAISQDLESSLVDHSKDDETLTV